MTDWMEKAKEAGFDRVSDLDPSGLEAMESVRDMCAQNRCRSYDKNWMCPPACGDIEECQNRMRALKNGMIVQTIGQLSKDIDSKGYAETMERHNKQFRVLTEQMAAELPNALFLGSGPCTYCKQCAYPAPCRFPEHAISSMEAYGLFVTQVCRDCGIPYYHGPKTITYTACILW